MTEDLGTVAVCHFTVRVEQNVRYQLFAFHSAVERRGQSLIHHATSGRGGQADTTRPFPTISRSISRHAPGTEPSTHGGQHAVSIRRKHRVVRAWRGVRRKEAIPRRQPSSRRPNIRHAPLVGPGHQPVGRPRARRKKGDLGKVKASQAEILACPGAGDGRGRRPTNVTAVLVLCYSVAVFCKLAAPGGPRKLYYNAADSFKVFQSFPNAVAIIDSDNDTLFNCWTAERTEIDHETQSATYAALFPTVRKARLFYVKAEKNSPKFTFTLDDDPTPKEGMFYYTDYENCVIEDLEYHGHQCVLWVRKELKNSVPQICINHFADTCGVGVPKHSRDLCRDD